MAELITNKDLDNTKKPQQQNSVPGMVNGVNTSNQQPNQAQQTGQQQRKQGTGFTNIGRILQANQGNRLGQAVGGGIQNTVQNVRTNLQNQQNAFGQQIQEQKNIINQDQQLKNQALQQLSGNNEAQAYDDLAKKAQDFSRIREGAYFGPSALENPEVLQAQAQDASFLGNAVNQSGGRQVLLQRFAGNPQYTQGQQRIDNLLLGKQLDPLRQARRQAIGLGNQTESQIKAAEALARGTQAEKSQLGQQTTEALGGAQKTFESDLNNKVTQAKERQAVETQRYKDILAGKALATDEDVQNFKNMGFDLDRGLFGVDLTSDEFFKNKAANVGNVANEADYAKYSALNQLMGQTGTLLGQDRSKAGEFNKGPIVNLDSEQALARIQSAQNQFEDANRGLSNYSRAAELLNPVFGQLENLNPNAPTEAFDAINTNASDYANKVAQAKALIQQSGLYSPNRDSSWEKLAGFDNVAEQLRNAGQNRNINTLIPNLSNSIGSLRDAVTKGSAYGQAYEENKQKGGAYDSFSRRQAALRKLLETQNPAIAPTVGS